MKRNSYLDAGFLRRRALSFVSACVLACPAALFPQQLKPMAQGIYYVDRESSTARHNDPTTWPCWSSPVVNHIHGVVARETWEEYEPTEGVYNDLGFLSIIASKAAAAGLQYEIQITINGGGQYPSWVTAAGAKTVTLHSDQGVPNTALQPGDPVFQAKLLAMLIHLGATYDADVNCRVVMMSGPGRSGECVFCSQNPSFISDWDWLNDQSRGTVDAEDLWEDWAQTIASYYAFAFPTTRFQYASGAPVPRSVDPNNDTFNNVVTFLVNTHNGTGVRFGTSSHGYYLGTPSYDYGTGLQGYQQTLPTGAPGAGDEASALLGNDNNGVPYNAKWFEIYNKDCELSGNWPGMDQFNLLAQ